MTTKQKPDDRRAQILQAAIDEARARGFNKMTRDGVAARCSLATGSINKYFTTMTQLRRDVMRAAVRDEILCIIADGLAARDPQAQRASADLQQRALATLAA